MGSIPECDPLNGLHVSRMLGLGPPSLCFCPREWMWLLLWSSWATSWASRLKMAGKALYILCFVLLLACLSVQGVVELQRMEPLSSAHTGPDSQIRHTGRSCQFVVFGSFRVQHFSCSPAPDNPRLVAMQLSPHAPHVQVPSPMAPFCLALCTLQERPAHLQPHFKHLDHLRKLSHARRYASVSLGQGQEPIAEQRLADFHKRGGWLLLQNIHLTIDWTTTVLDARVDKLSEGAHPDFRCRPLLPALALCYLAGLPWLCLVASWFRAALCILHVAGPSCSRQRC